MKERKSSSEETDKSELSIDDTRTTGSRSYECVFCRRGFTTAQALGGHMNIHRKDRAKSRPSSVPILLSGTDDNYPTIKSYTYQPDYSIAPEVHVSYQAFFPVSGWGFRPPYTAEFFVDNSQHPNRSLSLRIGPSPVDDHRNKKADGSIGEDELDLELRLGHDP
ncbi:transcriptional regulator SUPERMAN-like isoform X2 [Hibiscus syriacus]|uniref:transcriptional regulator SUPERMAN-like isoform X2 n=1 Tax=Hibiscus syriacus TaxID=106335 RepID=UPI001920A493|nr:transcriptional regulator SUPERMAN-like isoform X2 [Hibiscus syriacus]